MGGLLSLSALVEAAEHFVEGRVGGSQFHGMVKELFRDREPLE
jgi:hypothetical protein